MGIPCVTHNRPRFGGEILCIQPYPSCFPASKYESIHLAASCCSAVQSLSFKIFDFSYFLNGYSFIFIYHGLYTSDQLFMTLCLILHFTLNFFVLQNFQWKKRRRLNHLKTVLADGADDGLPARKCRFPPFGTHPKSELSTIPSHYIHGLASIRVCLQSLPGII